MAEQLIVLQSRMTLNDGDGSPAAGGYVTFYRQGTTTLASVFADQAGSVALPNPLYADGSGRLPLIFVANGDEIKAVIRSASGALIDTIDPCFRGAGAATSATSISYSPISTNPTGNVQDAIDHVSNALVAQVSAAQDAAITASQPRDVDLTAMAGVSVAGFLARTGDGTAAARTLTVPANGGIAITNPAGTAGNPVISLPRYESPAQSITFGGVRTLTHGLGAAPRFLSAYLKCLTEEAGYAVGDEVFVNPGENAVTDASHGHSIIRTDTQIIVRYGSIGYQVINKGTGNASSITAANWQLFIIASR